MRLVIRRSQLVAAALTGLLLTSSVFAQNDDATEAAKEKAEVDPAALPEGGVPELQKYISEIRRLKPAQRTIQSYSEHYRRYMPAIIKACDRILELQPNATQSRSAKLQKLSALQGLSRYDRTRASDAEAWAKTLSEDENPETAKVGRVSWLGIRSGRAGAMKEEEIDALMTDVFAFIDETGIDRTSFGLTRGLARSLEYAGKYDSAAGVLERVQPLLEKSKDEQLAAYAPKLTGAVKRLRLPGNPIVLTGTTADGSEFEWSEYKGKVVLVDFWASWCGPCIRELPNVEKNYEAYHDKGFEVVGINMDRTRGAMERFLSQRNVTWTHLVSFEKGRNAWDHPTAVSYGISAIPSTMLIDQEGNVVSLRARGPELGRLLEKLLGPAGDKSSDK